MDKNNILKTGDKIDIKCKSGEVHELCFTANGQRINNVTSMQINADMKRGLKVSLSLFTPIVSLKNVEISEIIDSNPKIDEIKSIFEEYHVQFHNEPSPSKKDVLDKIAKVVYGDI